MLQGLQDWLREFVTDRPRQPLQYGILKCTQEDMAAIVKGWPVTITDADGGWEVQGSCGRIFVPYNQAFKFPGRDTIFVQRSSQLDTVLDRMEAGFEDRY